MARCRGKSGNGYRLLSGLVPVGLAAISWALGVASIAAFLFLINYTARLLRPTAFCREWGNEGSRLLRGYLRTWSSAPAAADSSSPWHIGTLWSNIGQSLFAGGQLNAPSGWRRADGVIELVPRVGDFVATVGAAISPFRRRRADRRRILHAQVALGPERTIKQDTTFAFRVIVDIGIKALSHAINDPSTAVIALDQLHRLLRLVGRQHLHETPELDANGKLRLIFQTPEWDDFVQLAVSQIRLYGAGNFQVSRRLRAMIENLLGSLPEKRRPPLRRELDLLDRALPKLHEFAEDLDLARKADFQGLGGSSKR